MPLPLAASDIASVLLDLFVVLLAAKIGDELRRFRPVPAPPTPAPA